MEEETDSFRLADNECVCVRGERGRWGMGWRVREDLGEEEGGETGKRHEKRKKRRKKEL